MAQDSIQAEFILLFRARGLWKRCGGGNMWHMAQETAHLMIAENIQKGAAPEKEIPFKGVP